MSGATQRPPFRIQALIEEVRRHSPEWAERLAEAATEWEVPIGQVGERATPPEELRNRISLFMTQNLHKGPTLKLLAQFLGYSEKYCSELFRNVMGEPFSESLKRLRVRKAEQWLAGTPTPIADIAESLGFSDQFAFSHFFKKAVGCSPRKFREGVRSRLRGAPRGSFRQTTPDPLEGP